MLDAKAHHHLVNFVEKVLFYWWINQKLQVSWGESFGVIELKNILSY
jgi:hypothetical protein